MVDHQPENGARTDEPIREIPPDDSQLLAELRALYAEELEYPEDILTDQAAFEADLGLDSLTQMTTLVMVLERYGMKDFADNMPATEYPNLASVVALLRALAERR